ncbi:MAG: type IV pilus secretin PilQ [Thermodesulfobacteriota bacterium]
MNIRRGINDRMSRGWHASPTLRLLYVLFLVVLLAGCGPRKVALQETLQQETTAEADVILVESIGVVGEGDSILIEASGKIKYTAFRLADPPRLLIDMPGVSLDKVDKPIIVNNDYISEIATSTYGEGEKKIGRIEVGLSDGIEHDIKVGDDSIMVALRKNIYVSGFAAPEEIEEEYQVDLVEPMDLEEEVSEALAEEMAVAEEVLTDVKMETPPVVSGKGDKIVRIETTGGENESIVRIVGNGPPSSYNSFGLDSPARLVIDIWGAQNVLHERSIDVSDAFVKRVRIGDHPDKSRIVIDFSGENVPPHSIDKVDNALKVTFGEVSHEEEATQEVMPDVPEVALAPVEEEVESIEPEPIEPVVSEPESIEPESAPLVQVAQAEPERRIQVESIDFSRVGEKARLKIVTSELAHYKVSKSEDATVIALDLDDAAISDNLSRILDASELKTPVATISSFQASEAPDSVVRVLVKLKGPSLYGLSQKGNAIYVDFPVPKVEERHVAKSGAVPQTGAEGTVAGRYGGRHISLDLTDADINNVLRLIAEVSNLNIISGDDVRGKVSLRLIDVPWDQAFDIILRTKGLGKIQEGNVVMVAPLPKIKREEEGRLASKKAKEKLEDLDIKLIPVNYAKASDLETHIKNVLSDRGTVSTEKRTNTLIVRDVKATLKESVKLVKKLDLPTPQVLIETRIVEAQSTFARDLGVQWGVDYQTTAGTSTNTRTTSVFGSHASEGTDTAGQGPPVPGSGGGTSGSSSGDTTSFTRTSGASNYAVNLPATGTAGALGGLGFVVGKLVGTNPLLLDLRLTAGEQAGLTKTISRPRITTLDNSEAKIEQGESIPFETTSATGTATEFVDANLSLTVTPHITPDGSVLMKIKASRNSIGSFRTASGAPSINKKEASTEVLVKDGETTVIGGIVVSDKSDTDRGIPYLKSIPILGWLFKSKSVSDTQTELLIFITPSIIKDTRNS